MHKSVVFRVVLGVALLAAATWYVVGLGPGGSPPPVGEGSAVLTGGRLRATYSTEPTNYLRMVAPAAPNQMVSSLTQATLVRLAPTGELEPRLAESWSVSEDGRTWTLTLREASFSDGTPVTAADVEFTVRAATDSRSGSAQGGDLQAGGRAVTVRALDSRRLEVEFAAPFGPGLSIFENLAILPRHKLQAALDGGQLASVWSMSVDPAEVVGAGPFVVREYLPGQRLLFARNPHFFGRDDQGRPLPYVDEVEISIVPAADAELVRLLSGESDLLTDRAAATDLAVLRQAESEGKVQLTDAGPAIDVNQLWFNLKPGAPAAASRPWLQAPEFRRAISHAVNRQAIVDTVFLGEGVPIHGPVTPGHGQWYVPDLPVTEFDLTRARTLLTSIGLVDRDGDGLLDDAAGQPVRFSILTGSGQPERERTVAVLQEQLRQVGLQVDIVTLSSGELVNTRFIPGDYDAIYFGARAPSRDPIRSMDFWLSSGGFHFWNPGQSTPATEWEARIDGLMQRQAVTVDVAERRRLFADAQRILDEELPALYFAAPRVTIPVGGRVRGATPIIFFPPVLWNAERLWLADGGR